MWNNMRLKAIEMIKTLLRALLTTLQRAWWKLRWQIAIMFVQVLEEIQGRLPEDEQQQSRALR